MELTENSLILRTGKFKENDLWVKMLTPSHGILTAFAFGASKSRRRFTGCLDSYNYVLSRISSSKNGQFLNLQETSLLESYSTIRKNWQKQGLVANCINFLEAFGVSSIEANKIFALTKAFLFFVNELDEKKQKLNPVLPQLFRFRMAAESGYSLDFTNCRNCNCSFEKEENRQNGAYFLVSEGYFVCRNCKPLGMMTHFASSECLMILENVQESTPDNWDKYQICSEAWREVGRIIDALIRYHLGFEWHEGRLKRN